MILLRTPPLLLTLCAAAVACSGPAGEPAARPPSEAPTRLDPLRPLTRGTPEERLAALEELLQRPEGPLRAHLIERLGDPDPDLRHAAALALLCLCEWHELQPEVIGSAGFQEVLLVATARSRRDPPMNLFGRGWPPLRTAGEPLFPRRIEAERLHQLALPPVVRKEVDDGQVLQLLLLDRGPEALGTLGRAAAESPDLTVRVIAFEALALAGRLPPEAQRVAEQVAATSSDPTLRHVALTAALHLGYPVWPYWIDAGPRAPLTPRLEAACRRALQDEALEVRLVGARGLLRGTRDAAARAVAARAITDCVEEIGTPNPGDEWDDRILGHAVCGAAELPPSMGAPLLASLAEFQECEETLWSIACDGPSDAAWAPHLEARLRDAPDPTAWWWLLRVDADRAIDWLLDGGCAAVSPYRAFGSGSLAEWALSQRRPPPRVPPSASNKLAAWLAEVMPKADRQVAAVVFDLVAWARDDSARAALAERARDPGDYVTRRAWARRLEHLLAGELDPELVRRADAARTWLTGRELKGIRRSTVALWCLALLGGEDRPPRLAETIRQLADPAADRLPSIDPDLGFTTLRGSLETGRPLEPELEEALVTWALDAAEQAGVEARIAGAALRRRLPRLVAALELHAGRARPDLQRAREARILTLSVLSGRSPDAARRAEELRRRATYRYGAPLPLRFAARRWLGAEAVSERLSQRASSLAYRDPWLLTVGLADPGGLQPDRRFLWLWHMVERLDRELPPAATEAHGVPPVAATAYWVLVADAVAAALAAPR